MFNMGKKVVKWKEIPAAVKASAAYAACSVLQRCLSFITMPLFTRLLTVEQYGQSTIYSSWSGILTIFITLNLAYGSFSTAMVKFENCRDEYISSVEGICLSLAVVFCLIYLPFRHMWNRLFELPTLFILLMVLEILCSTAVQLWSGKKRFEFRYKSVIAVTLLSSAVAPATAFLLVSCCAEKGYARIAGYAAANIVAGGILYIFNLLKGKKLYSAEFWKYAFGFNVPLLAYYISQIIFNQSDRIMISHICGTGKAAMYGVAYNLAMVLTFVLNAVNNSYIPWFYEKIKKGRQKENKTVSSMIAFLMAFLLLGVIWFAPEIIFIMAGEKYAEAVWAVPPVAMSLLLSFYTQLFTNIEFYFEEKKLLVAASVWAAILNIVLNALLIPRFGFVAAGYTTLASYVVFAVSNYLASKSVLKKRGVQEDGYDLRRLIVIFIVFSMLGALGAALYPYFLCRMFFLLSAVAAVFIVRKSIWRDIEKFMKRGN